jgi:hypothetical protein
MGTQAPGKPKGAALDALVEPLLVAWESNSISNTDFQAEMHAAGEGDLTALADSVRRLRL